MTICKVSILLLAATSLCLQMAHADESALPADIEPAIEQLQALGVPAETGRQLLQRWQAVAEGPPADSLVSVIAGAVRRQAPVDLITDKIAEGLAKGVTPTQLLPAVDRWGRELSLASEVAQRLHTRLEPGDVTLRETVLRVHLLRRGQGTDTWLRQLFAQATESDPDVGTFLDVSEAVMQLQENGIETEQAVHTGQRWLAAGVPASQVRASLDSMLTHRQREHAGDQDVKEVDREGRQDRDTSGDQP